MGWNFEMKGLAQNINFLEKFNEDVAKTLKKELRSGALDVAKASRSLMPARALTNWGSWTFTRDGRDLGWNQGTAKRGVQVENYRSRMSGVTVGFGYRVVNTTPVGAIYELAGAPKSPSVMGGVLREEQRVSNYPRTLFAAYYMAMPVAVTKIETAIEKAKREASA